jgi:hypothetical protein
MALLLHLNLLITPGATVIWKSPLSLLARWGVGGIEDAAFTTQMGETTDQDLLDCFINAQRGDVPNLKLRMN